MAEEILMKYRVLRVLAWTLRIVGYIGIVVGIPGSVISVISAMNELHPDFETLGVLSTVAGAGLFCLFMGEVAFVLMDIEGNTRSKI